MPTGDGQASRGPRGSQWYRPQGIGHAGVFTSGRRGILTVEFSILRSSLHGATGSQAVGHHSEPVKPLLIQKSLAASSVASSDGRRPTAFLCGLLA
jgi:hypothetical protein